jgi:hypothetical protein
MHGLNSRNGLPCIRPLIICTRLSGNFGFMTGVTEMILQSHTGMIHLLPALPSATPNGSVQGLVARGNFVVDIGLEGGCEDEC